MVYYLNLIVITPNFFVGGDLNHQLAFSGTSLLIVVGVALEVIRQVMTHLATQQYDKVLFGGSDGAGEVSSNSSDTRIL